MEGRGRTVLLTCNCNVHDRKDPADQHTPTARLEPNGRNNFYMMAPLYMLRAQSLPVPQYHYDLVVQEIGNCRGYLR
jgi:hypothetical protein